MKKPVKKILATIGAVIGLLVLLCGIFIAKIHFETSKMSPLKTQKVIDGVVAVQDKFVNLFLIENGSSYIAVDAGNTADHIQHELQVLGIDPKTVTSVFLTHSDADHTGALELFYNAVIYLSKAEEQMINGQTHRFLFLKNKFKGKYELLEDNQLLNLSGLRVKAISTPGHTPGSMCFLINDTFLFTGDSMGLKNGKTTEFNDLFNMDTQTQKISLKKLADLPAAAYIFTAHYGFTVQGQDPFSTWKK